MTFGDIFWIASIIGGVLVYGVGVLVLIEIAISALSGISQIRQEWKKTTKKLSESSQEGYSEGEHSV